MNPCVTRSAPDTRIIAEDGGIGRSYPLDPLQGRDDNGPIFPVGDVDGRLCILTDDMIDAYIELRMEEVTRFEQTPHPVEFDMYYSV